jgi:hypothetical protein
MFITFVLTLTDDYAVLGLYMPSCTGAGTGVQR